MDADFHEVQRRQFWDMAFASLIGMNHHPGTTRDPAREFHMEQLADMADQALSLRDQRFGAPHE